MDLRRSMAAALLVLLAAAAPAAAHDAGTPLGTGSVGVAVAGDPVVVHHDPAGPGVGDDTLVVAEGVRQLEVRLTGAPLGGSASAGLRGLQVRHGLTPLVDDAIDRFVAALPAERRTVDLDVTEAGVEPWALGISLLSYPYPVWTTHWPVLGWGLAHDGVVLPTAIARSSEHLLANQYHQVVWHTCWGIEFNTGQPVPGCDGPEPPLLDELPNVVLQAELQAASVVLLGAGGAAGPAPSGTGATPATMPEAPAAAGAGHDTERAFVALPHGSLDASRSDAAALPDDGPSARPGSGPLGALSGAVPPSYALPLVLGALATLVPVWALYRRILPHRALAHPMRERILAAVRARPGVHESDLARELGLRHNHVQYHLRVLEDAGVLETRHFGGLKCIFELGRLSPAEKALAMAQRGRSQEVLQAVSGEPGICQRTIAQRLGMSESSVKWHLDRLEGSGVVRTERARGAKRAWPAAVLLGPTLAPPPAALVPGAVPPAA